MWAYLEPFSNKAVSIGARNNSRIVLALDIHSTLKKAHYSDFFIRVLSLLNGLRGLLAGVKIGWPTILTLGEEALYRLINEYDWGFFFIADIKLADVGHINRIIVEHMADIGFDAIISHSFIGREKGLEEAVSSARDHGLGILSLSAMSHPGGREVLNKNFEYLLSISMSLDVDGLVLPSTMPEYIRLARDRGFKGLIFSPGIGVQGASPGTALGYGADFEIIGRLIYNSDDPRERVMVLLDVLRW